MNVRTVTGSLTAAQAAVVNNTDDMDEVAYQLTGTFVGTVTFEGTLDGTNWVALAMVPGDSTTPTTLVTTATVPGLWYARNVVTYLSTRARCSAYTSGTIVITSISGRVARS